MDSGKIILTQEQADAIERLKNFIKEDETLDCQFIRKDIARVLLSEYETKPKYSVGDWVITEGYSEKYDGRALKITKAIEVRGDRFYYFENSDRTIDFFIEIRIKRHATKEEIEKEKERQWWAKHGREPWELEKNDLLVSRGGNSYTVKRVRDGHVDFKEFGCSESIDLIKEKFKIACFAEDREDL